MPIVSSDITLNKVSIIQQTLSRALEVKFRYHPSNYEKRI